MGDLCVLQFIILWSFELFILVFCGMSSGSEEDDEEGQGGKRAHTRYWRREEKQKAKEQKKQKQEAEWQSLETRLEKATAIVHQNKVQNSLDIQRQEAAGAAERTLQQQWESRHPG